MLASQAAFNTRKSFKLINSERGSTRLIWTVLNKYLRIRFIGEKFVFLQKKKTIKQCAQ
jgi:hypothetical protein